MRAVQRTLLSSYPHSRKHSSILCGGVAFSRVLQEKMSPCVLLTALFTIPLALGWVIPAEREEVQMVCAGKEFHLPVYSTSRTVTFTPNPEGQRRVLLEKTVVKDPRFEWTRDKMLILKEVTHSDQGLYAIKLSSGFTYETVRLIVSECIKSYRRNYGENFEHNIPENGSLLEFSPRGAPSEAMPIVLWNRTNPGNGVPGRGRLLRAGKVWVADRVTQVDQGNYTVRDVQGKVLSRSTLTVRGHSSNVTRFSKETLNLPLFLPVNHAHLIFTPTRHSDESSLGPFDPKPPHGPVQLIHKGQITDYDVRYRGLISLGRNGSINEVVIVRLTSRHDGLYEIRDGDGNLVSSTLLQVIEKGARWRALLKSITVPSGMLMSLVGFTLFMKRFPNCSLSQIISGLRVNHASPGNPPRVNIQDYSQPISEPSDYHSHSQQHGTPRKWTPRASPTHSTHTPVRSETPRAENRETHRLAAEITPSRISVTERNTSDEGERRISFSVPGASDCLHSSEACVQFQIKTDGDTERLSKSQQYFSAMPLEMKTSESCSVYTSTKLNFS